MFLANAFPFDRGYAGMLRNINATGNHLAFGS